MARLLPDLVAALPLAPAGAGRFWRVELARREPDRVRAFCAVRVTGSVQLRSEQHGDAEVPVGRAELGARPAPPELGAELSYGFVREVLDPSPRRCSWCAPDTPGWQLCVCRGTSEFGCSACENVGLVRCSICEGEAQVVLARVTHGAYTTERVDRIDVPLAAAGGHVWALRMAVHQEAPAEALSLPLEARANRGPYRDAPTAETDFHGFAYGQALRLAREFAADRRARAIDAELRLTAVPFLEVLWRSFVRSHRALLHVGADGSPRWIGDLE